MLIKTKQDIAQIVKSGKIIGEILSKLAKMVVPGVSTFEVDAMAEKLIIKAGGKPAFKGYRSHADDIPFPSTICASCNAELVHGIAKKDKILKSGDIFSVDIGMEWPYKKGTRGFFSDTAITVAVGDIDPRTRELMRVTRQSLEEGIKAIKPGRPLSDIGHAVEDYVKSQGRYGIVRDLVGHGVGHDVHEAPSIPNYYDKNLDKFIMRPGMVLAIEPMISLGDWRVKTADDGWTIEMSDGSMCAHYEHTVIVTARGHEVATRRPNEKKEML